MGEKKEILEIPFGISATIVIAILFIIVLLLGGVGNRKKAETTKEVIPDLVSAPKTNTVNRVKEIIPKKRKTSERQATQGVVMAQADVNQALVFALRRQAEAREKGANSNQDFDPGKEGLIRLDR